MPAGTVWPGWIVQVKISPFGAVDWRTSEDLLRLIERWHREQRTVAAVLHDLDQVRTYFPDSLLIARECVAWGATREVLMPHNLRRARQMSEAWSPEAEDCRRVPIRQRPAEPGAPTFAAIGEQKEPTSRDGEPQRASADRFNFRGGTFYLFGPARGGYDVGSRPGQAE